MIASSMAHCNIAVVRPPVVFPEHDQTYLLQGFKKALDEGRQCHPKLKAISHGEAVFESSVDIEHDHQYKIRYLVICRVPLDDELFEMNTVQWLYYSQAAEYARFIPQSFVNKDGYQVY